MCIRYSVKYILTLLCAVLLGVNCWAEPSSGRTHNYLWLSLAGGEANNISYGTDIRALAGAAADVGLGYELQYRRFIFGVGVEADYQLQRDQMDTYLDEYSRLDREGEDVIYGYLHTNYCQSDRAIRLVVPVYIGGRLGEYMYALLGASFDLPLWNRYDVQTHMLTQGTYAWSIEPVRSQGINDFSSYGYYADSEYAYQSRYQDQLSLHARAEIGCFLPVPRMRKAQLRLGVYGSYGIRLGSVGEKKLLDVSSVDLHPLTQTQANLQEHVRWQPVNTSALYSHLPHNLEVGVRLTVLMNVDVKTAPCHCVAD